MQLEAVQQLIDQLPDTWQPFAGAEYSNPVRSTFVGERQLEIGQLRSRLLDRQAGPATDLLESI